MATKKNEPIKEIPEGVTEEVKAVAREIEEQKAKAETAEAPEQPVDEWEQFIDIVVPRHGRGQEKTFFVSVNGRNAQIPADGKLQHLRKPHAVALLDSLEAEANAEQFAEDLPHEAAPASFADLMNVINDLRRKLRDSGIEV